MLFKVLAQVVPNAAPFPNGPPAPGSTITNFGEISGSDAVKSASDAGATAASGADHLWQEWVSPDSPVYQALIHATVPLAVLAFILWGTFWAREAFQDSNKDKNSLIHLQKAVWPLIIILLFHSNGALLADFTLAGKWLTYGVANEILNMTGGNITAKEQIQNLRLQQAYNNYLSQQLDECKAITDIDEKKQCQQNAQSNAVKLAKQATGNQTGLPDQGGNFLVAQFKVAFAGAIVGILWASAAAFHYIAGILLAVWASTGPFWLSITLLPFNTKGITFFVSGFIGFSVIIIINDLLNAAAAVSLAQATNSDPLFVPFMMGLLNPILAFLIGSGTGVGMFVGIASLASWSVGKFLP